MGNSPFSAKLQFWNLLCDNAFSTRIAHPAGSWLDDYFSWLTPGGNPPCCRYDNVTGAFCPATCESSCTACVCVSVSVSVCVCVCVCVPLGLQDGSALLQLACLNSVSHTSCLLQPGLVLLAQPPPPLHTHTFMHRMTACVCLSLQEGSALLQLACWNSVSHLSFLLLPGLVVLAQPPLPHKHTERLPVCLCVCTCMHAFVCVLNNNNKSIFKVQNLVPRD